MPDPSLLDMRWLSTFHEEGTWTPTFGGSTTNGTITYDVQLGRYTRIGTLCIARFRINTATVTATPTGNLQIKGLPFTAATVAVAVGPSYPSDYSNINLTAGYTQLGLRVDSAAATATFVQSGDNIGAAFVAGGSMTGADVEVVGMLIYEVA